MCQVFYILLAEKDKTMFMVYLRGFRNKFQRYNMPDLRKYFEDFYFKPERIKQWACWYRVQMFNCEWILDTNMYVEGWHDVLKSHVLDKKKEYHSLQVTSYFEISWTKQFLEMDALESGDMTKCRQTMTS